MLKKNKHGDVPITLLVLGIFVVCTLAILTFIRSDMQTKTSFSGIQIMERANLDIEQGNLGHYYLEKKVKKIVPSFSLDWIKEVVIFSVEYNP
jgi:hypothetical protein